MVLDGPQRQGKTYKGSEVLSSSDLRPKLNRSLNSQDRENLCVLLKTVTKGTFTKSARLLGIAQSVYLSFLLCFAQVSLPR